MLMSHFVTNNNSFRSNLGASLFTCVASLRVPRAVAALAPPSAAAGAVSGAGSIGGQGGGDGEEGEAGGAHVLLRGEPGAGGSKKAAKAAAAASLLAHVRAPFCLFCFLFCSV